MKITNELYSSSLALFNDFYQLSMAYGYWKSGIAEKEAVFNLFFRKNPFNGGFTINCGLDYVIDYVNSFHFSDDDIAYLATLTDEKGGVCFPTIFWPTCVAWSSRWILTRFRRGKSFFPMSLSSECGGLSFSVSSWSRRSSISSITRHLSLPSRHVFIM